MRYYMIAGLLMTFALGCDELRDELPDLKNLPDVRVGDDSRKEIDSREDGAANAPDVAKAICVLAPIGDSGVSGTVHFRREGSSVQIEGEIRGLTPGKHGFHIHEFGDRSDQEKGESAGGHFNPLGEAHGKQRENERHVGDLGNIEADEQGVAQVSIRDDQIQLSGAHSILGRALVVHSGEDKFTQPSGGAGGRVAMGVVGVAK